MPKWDDRKPVAPLGGAIRPPAPVVDISPPPPPAPKADPRVPMTVSPSEVKAYKEEVKRYVEKLRVNRNPSPEGVTYEIDNIGGMCHYAVVLRHRGTGMTFSSHAKSREGCIQVPRLSNLSGVWDALLLIDLEVADRIEVELELSQEWLAELIGKALVFFSPTEGPLDRLGSTILTPSARKTPVAVTDEDVAISIILDNLPDVIPAEAQVTLQVMRPGDAGIYYRTQSKVYPRMCYRMMISGYLPCSEPGDWQIVVSMGSKVLANETLKLAGRKGVVTKNKNPVEEFNGRLVN